MKMLLPDSTHVVVSIIT